MLNVWMSVLIGLAVNPEPVDDADLEMSVAAEPDAPDVESVEPDEELDPRQWTCKYGDELEQLNYCLARCGGSNRLYEILGYPMEEDRWTRDLCKGEAKNFCRGRGRSYRGWCWG